MTVLLLAMAIGGSPYPANMQAGEGYVPCDRQCRTERRWRRAVRPYRGWLRSLAWCESTDNPRAYNPAGPYYGLYQFSESTWHSVGGSGLPSGASRLEQSYRAVKLRKRSGTGQWPVCG